MNTITTEAVITSGQKLNLNIDLPKDCPTGAVTITLTIEPRKDAEPPVNRLAEIRGMGRGQVWMSDDFDEPLDDFAEYM